MAESASIQLSLRRAFRYGFFAFVALAVSALALLGFWIVEGDATASLLKMIPDRAVITMIALIVGLSVPLFFAAWLLVGTALLGGGVSSRRPLTDGLYD